MEKQNLVEVYSAGCAVCDEAVALVERIAGSFEVKVHHMTDIETVKKEASIGDKDPYPRGHVQSLELPHRGLR